MEGKIKTSSGKELSVPVKVRSLPPSEQRKHALKALGLCWGIALLSAPLPPIHWVTVPGFFFFGIYWALKKWREGRHFEELAFPCPECQKEVKLAPQAWQNPLVFVCPHCRYSLRLELPQA